MALSPRPQLQRGSGHRFAYVAKENEPRSVAPLIATDRSERDAPRGEALAHGAARVEPAALSVPGLHPRRTAKPLGEQAHALSDILDLFLRQIGEGFR